MKRFFEGVFLFFVFSVVLLFVAVLLFRAGPDGETDVPLWFAGLDMIFSSTLSVFLCSSVDANGKKSRAWVFTLAFSTVILSITKMIPAWVGSILILVCLYAFFFFSNKQGKFILFSGKRNQKQPGFQSRDNTAKEYLVPAEPIKGKYYTEDTADLLSMARYSAERINKADTLGDFENAFLLLVREMQRLMWYNEREKIYMSTQTPRENLSDILSNMEATINAFIDRASNRIALFSRNEADEYEALAEGLKSNKTFAPFLTDQNYTRIEALYAKANEAREKAREAERERKKQEDLQNVGSESGLDLSDLDAMKVIVTIENKLSDLYKAYLSGEWGSRDGAEIFSKFMNACRSSKLPLMAEIRLESLMTEYGPKFSSETTMFTVDQMSGSEFESWCAGLLRRNWFSNVELTTRSKDQGVDITAEKDGIRYAFQCKCYASDLGNKSVQEVHTGQAIYHCHVGVVMTNRHFTAGAKKAADATGVLLWDRDKLLEMLEK